MAYQQPVLDELDRRILAALIANARSSFTEIGQAVGLSAPAVKRRVDRMRDDDVITGFTTIVRPAALGWRTEAYVEVFCDGAAPPRRLAEVTRNHPEVVAAVTVTGGADALLHIRAADIGHFEEVLERIRAEPFVTRTNSFVVLTHLLPNSPEAGSPAAAPGAHPDARSDVPAATPSDTPAVTPSDVPPHRPT
ncbi:Lrp/AsnC family transcriptional regulator [Streptomyces sp. NPDC056672]|uniref:Lrp/AsnC family transcriptional regulator n=1 Tax=Streptomyces sp. NPDC056672 TaxID=3345906 RepID=UPI0036787A99